MPDKEWWERGQRPAGFNEAAKGQQPSKENSQDAGLGSEQIRSKSLKPELHPNGPLRDAGARQAHDAGMAKDGAAAAAKNDRARQIAAEARRSEEAQKARQNQQNMKNSKDDKGKE